MPRIEPDARPEPKPKGVKHMGTPQDKYVDVVFVATPDKATFVTAMNALGWVGWDSDESDFDGSRCVSVWKGDLCLIRPFTEDWDLLTPPASMDVLHNLDRFVPRVFAIEGAPTTAEREDNNIFYHMSLSASHVAKIRAHHPQLVPGGENSEEQGLRFGGFDNHIDHKGALET